MFHILYSSSLLWVRVISLQTFNCDPAIGDPSVDDISHRKQFFYPVSYAANEDIFVGDIYMALKKTETKNNHSTCGILSDCVSVYM